MIWIAPSEKDTDNAARWNANLRRETTWQDLCAAQVHRGNFTTATL
jgi:hypothetical protein